MKLEQKVQMFKNGLFWFNLGTFIEKTSEFLFKKYQQAKDLKLHANTHFSLDKHLTKNAGLQNLNFRSE